MRNSFTAIVAGFVLTFSLVLTATQVSAQAIQSAEPFKVATFTVDGRQLIGLVLRDQLVVEIDAAND
ncbi:MAG: hypothetical protein VX276_03675, partial [Pseudomonadota bacterium]|nr:hypothetical protein [Pseudomonadota bacterium]